MTDHAISLSARVARQVNGGLRDIFAANPSLLPFGLGVLGWSAMLLPAAKAPLWPICTSVTPASSLVGVLLGQGLMLVAMMAPLVSAPIHHIVARSFESRQLRGSLMFLIAYLAVWLVIAAALVPVSMAVQTGGAKTVKATAAIMLMVAAFWQVLPFKQAAIRRCARAVPLRQDGYRADLACLRYGVAIALDCIAACWALMLAPIIAPNGLGTMILVQGIILAERDKARPDTGASAIGLIVWAAATILT